MSIFRRLWQSFRSRPISRSGYVGRDLEGNTFFEYPSSTTDPRRTKRTVKYTHPDNFGHYIDQRKTLPVQWTAWMTHTRPHPPTLEELELDQARQQRVRTNAALIEARDREERAEQLRLLAQDDASRGNKPETVTSEEPERTPPTAASNPPAPPASSAPLPRMATEPEYEPESWTPRAQPRGGSK